MQEWVIFPASLVQGYYSILYSGTDWEREGRGEKHGRDRKIKGAETHREGGSGSVVPAHPLALGSCLQGDALTRDVQARSLLLTRVISTACLHGLLLLLDPVTGQH